MGLAQKKTYCNGGNSMDMEKEERLFTINDIETLPKGERAELIDGRMYMMAPPTAEHQRMVVFLCTEFKNYIDKRNGECEVFVAPFAVYLNETNNYVEPDVVVICDKDKIDNKGCHGGPDFVIEIVSPNSVRMDYAVKLFKYRTYGVREYWIVDMEKNRTQVYDLEHDDMKEYTLSDEIPVGIYAEDFKIDFSKF